jgi:hypothetical protein
VLVGDADPVDLAYLLDHVLVRHGRLQLFGTQYEPGRDGPRRWPVDHPDRATDRRRRLGIADPPGGCGAPPG